MPKKQTKRATTSTRESAGPASVTVKAKTAKEKRPQPRAKTTKDWRNEEENEGQGRSVRGHVGGPFKTIEQELAKSHYSWGNWGDPAWKDKNGTQLIVSLWFPVSKVAIDYPETKEELILKQEAFKKLKVPYLGVLPGKALDMDEARAALKKQGAKI